jgi:hypothetical protein
VSLQKRFHVYRYVVDFELLHTFSGSNFDAE